MHINSNIGKGLVDGVECELWTEFNRRDWNVVHFTVHSILPWTDDCHFSSLDPCLAWCGKQDCDDDNNYCKLYIIIIMLLRSIDTYYFLSSSPSVLLFHLKATKHKPSFCTQQNEKTLPHSILLSPALLRDTTHGEHGLSVQHGEVRQEILCEPQSFSQNLMVRMVLGRIFEQILWREGL